jgi:hypothetical protein
MADHSPFLLLRREHGTRGLVRALVRATARADERATARLLGALLTLDAPPDRGAARGAGAERAVAEALAAFPASRAVAGTALGALARVWAFDDAADTERLLDATLAALARHAGDALLQAAGVRLLKLHVRSAQQLVATPRVLAALERAMLALPADDAVQHWGAEAVVALNGIEPAALVKAHGALGYGAIAEASVRLCLATPRPATLQVGGVDWQAKVLAVHPRLRSQA